MAQQPQLEDYIDLSKYPNLTPEHKSILREMMLGAMDEDAPMWFRAHCEAMFAMLESGCERVEELIAQSFERGYRQPEYEGDEIGRWDD